jgi:hypothetical protein
MIVILTFTLPSHAGVAQSASGSQQILSRPSTLAARLPVFSPATIHSLPTILKFSSLAKYQQFIPDPFYSKLTCNQLKESFKEFVETVGPITVHLHIADAGGVDGEGLQIGEGDTDFAALAEDLDKTCPSASFIPEIWQAHTNEGEGFWRALDQLERYL